MLTTIRTALAGRYVLERELGRGSMAAVYAARDLKHGRRVALKVIESEVVSTLGTHRFLQEIRTTARLNHPHILPLFDSGEAEGFIYYTMPLVQGESLRQRIEKLGRMPLAAALSLIRQVASALSYAHSAGIVHRDIKPENILLGERDHVWVADFGLARALATAVDQRLTGTGLAVGSPQYMSPEQAAGQSDADGRSDIYSLGCIAFELLCGEPPFTAGTVPSLLAQHLSEPAPSISERCPGVPLHVDAALRRALSKDRSHRFANAEALAAALEDLEAQRRAGVAAPDVPRRSRVQRLRRPNRSVSQDQATAAKPPSGRRRFNPAPKPHGLRSFFRELRRRKVVSVLVAYSVAAAGVMQVIDIVAPRMDMPENTVNLVILLALAGLPLAAVLAWLYDLVPDARASREAAAASAVAPAASEPPHRAEIAAPWHAAALPTAATPFIGREEELRELRDLLCNSAARLVTVTGPGGVGKTRLALHIAEQVAPRFPDGVAYRALSGLAAPDLLVPALADSLGIPLSRREDPLIELKAYLHEKELLLVLDNFEHLTSAAGLLSTLLDDAPGVQMLVTTRERLNLKHERLVALDGLMLTGGDDSDAVKLFVAGACRLDSRFQLDADDRVAVARICELLGGIPLAIELASSWVRALSCPEILAELERDLDVLSNESPDLEERHRSLRATFDASWRLLSAEEQSALARLAVFRSAFDRTAAGQVADAGVPLLRQLVDKSLLTRAGDRLLMLDVVRTFALDRLTADPLMERRAHERHLACFAAMLHTLQHSVQLADAAAIQRVADSIDDIRAAWDYATQTNNAAALLRAMDGLFHFYEARGWAREGAEVFARTSTLIGDFSPQHDLARPTRLAAARLDTRHGVFLHRLGDLRSAESLLRRGVAAARDLEESAEIVFALHRLGAVRHGMGDYTEAERLHNEAWVLAQQMGDRLAVGWSLTHLGNVAWARGEFDTAARQYMDALELLREEHDANGMWVTLNNLGVLAASREQYREAQRRFREGLALQSELKNPRISAQALHNLGCAVRELGDFASARQSLEESLGISDRMGYQSIAAMSHVALAQLAMREDDMSGAEVALQRALGTARAVRNHPLALEALVTLARLRLQQGDTHGTAELAAAVARHPGSDRDVLRKAVALFEEIGGEPPPQDGSVDLDALIDRITGNRPAATPTGTAAVARRQHMHTQPAGDT